MRDYDTPLGIATAPKRNSKHWKQEVITWNEIRGWSTPADHRECGNYVLGNLTSTRRRKDTIQSRSVITLDADSPDPGFREWFLRDFPYAAIIHTTWSSTPENPRYRILVLPDRDLLPDEYHTAAAGLMQSWGEHNFDLSSVQPERYMFRPSAQRPEDFQFDRLDYAPAPAETLLQDFMEDLSALSMPKPSRWKRSPLELDGVPGAFNRLFTDWDELIDEFDLPYERVGENRWQLAGARSAAGMGAVTDSLVYSHHSNDPAAGQACSAFDLVRLHQFSHLDEDVKPGTPVNRLPSQKELETVLMRRKDVQEELFGGDFTAELDTAERSAEDDHQEQDAGDGNPNWWYALDRHTSGSRAGEVKDNIDNWDIITRYDSAFRGLYYNEMSMAIEFDGPLPWRDDTDKRPVFDDADRTQLFLHIERRYRFRPGKGYLDDMVTAVAKATRRNPVREYLQSLQWDGTPRVETCLPGVTPTAFTRRVAVKVLVAAVARMLEPGVKWDHTLIIYGTEGLGKSYWIEWLSNGFSAPLGRIDNKDTLMTMRNSWIMVSDEGHTMKKADHDAQKEFLTRTTDIFRAPYDREMQSYPRHSVIWGTTNDETFLRRQEGNRRFLIVHAEQAVDFDTLTDAYRDQLWAEAVELYRAGEPLFLTEEEERVASIAREEFTEEDSKAGIVQAYLEKPVPEDWYDWTPDSRRAYIHGHDPLMDNVVGTEQITRVCSAQLWVEALGRRYGEHSRQDLLELSEILKNLEGWEPLPGSHRIPGYGPQKVYEKVT